jgi:BlaI family transcriptional regulator, penicillinase repressor
MGRPAQDITESELAVLRVLWERGTASIRQLTDVLYKRGEAAQYATVQKLLDRMEAKGFVERDRTLFVHVFRAVLDRDEMIGRRLRTLAEMLCDGSLTPLLTHLARAQDLTEQDRLALRAIIDEADLQPGSAVAGRDKSSRAGSLEETSKSARPRSSSSGRGKPAR